MCKCCEEIEYLKTIYDKRYKILTRITTKSKNGIGSHEIYVLNYCPMCGRKLGD